MKGATIKIENTISKITMSLLISHDGYPYPVQTLANEWTKYAVICPECLCCKEECNGAGHNHEVLWSPDKDINGLMGSEVADHAYAALAKLAAQKIVSSEEPLMWADGYVTKFVGLDYRNKPILQTELDTGKNRLITLATHLRALMIKALVAYNKKFTVKC